MRRRHPCQGFGQPGKATLPFIEFSVSIKKSLANHYYASFGPPWVHGPIAIGEVSVRRDVAGVGLRDEPTPAPNRPRPVWVRSRRATADAPAEAKGTRTLLHRSGVRQGAERSAEEAGTRLGLGQGEGTDWTGRCGRPRRRFQPRPAGPASSPPATYPLTPFPLTASAFPSCYTISGCERRAALRGRPAPTGQ